MKYHPVETDIYHNLGRDVYYLNPTSLRTYCKFGIPHKTFPSRLEAERFLKEMGLEIVPSKRGYIAFGIED